MDFKIKVHKNHGIYSVNTFGVKGNVLEIINGCLIDMQGNAWSSWRQVSKIDPVDQINAYFNSLQGYETEFNLLETQLHRNLRKDIINIFKSELISCPFKDNDIIGSNYIIDNDLDILQTLINKTINDIRIKYNINIVHFNVEEFDLNKTFYYLISQLTNLLEKWSVK